MIYLKHLYHFVIFTLFVTGCATTPDHESAVNPESIAEKINLLNSKEIESIWLDYNVSEHPIIFVSDKEKWAKRLQEGKLTGLEYSSWKKALKWNSKDFDFITYLNGKYFVIFMDKRKSEQAILATILHESFHWFYQDENRGFKKSTSLQSRGAYYPILSRPRYFRWMMVDEIFSYLQNGESQHLEAYSWWFHEWVKQFPNEANNYTDRIEGSAQYYSILANNQISNLLNKHNKAPYRDPFFTKYDKDAFSIDMESYVLGPLTGFVLDKLEVPSWKLRVNQGEDSLSILASLYKPLMQKLNPILQTEFLNLSIQKMQEVDKDGKLDKTIVNLANPKVIKLVLGKNFMSEAKFNSNRIYKSFFNFNGFDDVMMIMLTSPYVLDSDNLSVQFKAGDIMTSARTPCDEENPRYMIFYKNSEVQFLNGKFVATGKYPLNLKVKKLINKNIYCAQ